jgi:ankyrin repeat protein
MGACLKLLLAAGADLSLRNQAGATALDIAEARDDRSLAAMLRGGLPVTPR